MRMRLARVWKFLQALPDGGGSAVDGERRSEGGGIGDGCLGLRDDGVADECGGQGEAERGGGEVTAGFCLDLSRRIEGTPSGFRLAAGLCRDALSCYR